MKGLDSFPSFVLSTFLVPPLETYLYSSLDNIDQVAVQLIGDRQLSIEFQFVDIYKLSQPDLGRRTKLFQRFYIINQMVKLLVVRNQRFDILILHEESFEALHDRVFHHYLLLGSAHILGSGTLQR